MSKKSENNLIFDVKKSLSLTCTVLALHLGAWIVVLSLPIALWLRALLLILVGLSLYHTLSLHALRRAPGAVCHVTLDMDGDWELRLNNADEQGPCRLRAHYVHPKLVLVQLRCPGAWWPLSLVLAADAVERDAFRRLRARLNLQSWAE